MGRTECWARVSPSGTLVDAKLWNLEFHPQILDTVKGTHPDFPVSSGDASDSKDMVAHLSRGQSAPPSLAAGIRGCDFCAARRMCLGNRCYAKHSKAEFTVTLNNR